MDPSPPGFRVFAKPGDVDPVIAMPARRSQKRRRAIIAFSAIAAIVASFAWANSPDAHSAAPVPKDGKSKVTRTDAATARGLDGTEPLTLSLGWGPPLAEKVDGLKDNPYDGVARAKAKRSARSRRGVRAGTLRKVDDPKPNPY